MPLTHWFKLEPWPDLLTMGTEQRRPLQGNPYDKMPQRGRGWPLLLGYLTFRPEAIDLKNPPLVVFYLDLTILKNIELIANELINY